MLLAALEAQLAERSQRQIAEALYGRAAVARAWQLDGGMRSEVRRRVDEALFYMEVGYRDRPIPASASTSTAGWGAREPAPRATEPEHNSVAACEPDGPCLMAIGSGQEVNSHAFQTGPDATIHTGSEDLKSQPIWM